MAALVIISNCAGNALSMLELFCGLFKHFTVGTVLQFGLVWVYWTGDVRLLIVTFENCEYMPT